MAARSGPEGDLMRLPALRILIVEDDAVAALGLKMFLVETGHDVVAMAETAPAAVHRAAATRPDLALVDIRLAEGTDGIEAALEIRRRFGIPSILMTAHADEATLRRARDAQPLDILPKPILPHRLRWSIKGAAALLLAGWQTAEQAAYLR